MNKKEIHSPLVITKEEGPLARIVKQYKYKAFGEMKYETGTYYDNHKFTGKEEDGSGLYYFGARYYDKSLGRWISPDPASMPSNLNLNDPQTLNPYVYCTNNPLRFIDPNGEYKTDVRDGNVYIVSENRQKESMGSYPRALPFGAGSGYGLLMDIIAWSSGDVTVGPGHLFTDVVAFGISCIIPGTGEATAGLKAFIGSFGKNFERDLFKTYAKGESKEILKIRDTRQIEIGEIDQNLGFFQRRKAAEKLLHSELWLYEQMLKIIYSAGGAEKIGKIYYTEQSGTKKIIEAYIERNKQ